MTLAPMNAASPQVVPPSPIYTAPPKAGHLLLGRTLPSLLDEACVNNPNPRALNQLTPSGWSALSTEGFRQQAEALALGLAELGLSHGDRVAFYTYNDLSFCLPDMACLLAGFVTVPLYLTHKAETMRFILRQTEAEVVVVSDGALLGKVGPLLEGTGVRTALVVHPTGAQAPKGVTLQAIPELLARGERERNARPEAVKALRKGVQAGDLATIIYTSGTTGTPKGVMLSHENISSNALAAFSGLSGLKRGEEVALSYLPLTHIFARTLHYGYLAWGTAVYFSEPERLREHFKEVRPTVFATVPRVLERVYEGIQKAGEELPGVKKHLFDWALSLARRFDPEKGPSALYSAQLKAADKLVFERGREALGGRLRYAIVGGAALRPELVRIFGAAGLHVLQGYGLTETSPIIAYNRPERNRPATVGPLLAGVEVKISKHGEILTRGPHVMKGYYKNPEETAKVLDENGWFHTGDLGEMSGDGFLKVTGRLKNLFKLSTGKYVMPQPLEERLEASPLVEHALVVGEGEKYPAALLFLNQKEVLTDETKREGLLNLVREANESVPEWSQIKRALLLSDPLSIENDALTPKLSVKRKEVLARYERPLRALFGHEAPSERDVILEVQAQT